MEESYDIFVGSLLSCVTQESLTTLFGKFGTILKLRILEKVTPKGMKYAFIQFSQESEALQAIEEMNEFMYNGIPLQVRKSDRWLKRTGEDKSVSKGSIGKKITGNKMINNTADIGLWEPPRAAKLNMETNSEKTSVNNSTAVSGPKNPGLTTRIFKESIAVTHVEDPVTFYGYFASKNAELDSLTSELQHICPTISPICGDPKENKVYASMYSADRQWYRCKVLEVDKLLSRALVQYVDFGNVERVSNESLVELPPRLELMSPFTMKCQFESLIPFPNNRARYEEAQNFLKTQLIDKIVSAVLHVKGNGSVLQVSEIMQNGVNLVDVMLKKDYIMPNLCADNNRNYTTRNAKAPTSIPSTFQGIANNKTKKKLSPEVQTISSNYNHMFNQEKAQLLAENKKLKYEFAQAMGKNKALETELHAVNQSLAEPNPYTELPAIIHDIEKVRLLRQQLPVRPNSIDYIDKGVLLLQECDNGSKPFDRQHREKIHEMVSQYYRLQEQILECTDKDKLQEIINQRNDLREKLCEELTSFCTAIHSDEAQERLQAIKTVLAEIRHTYQSFLKIKTFSETAMPVEELHNFYISSKSEKAKEFLEVQNRTNVAHRNFFKALQPASQNLEQRHVPCIGTCELTNALAEMKTSLAKEIRVCNMEDTPEASIMGVISHLLCDRLEMNLKSMEETRFLEKQYTSLLEDLSLSTVNFPPPGIELLMEKRKERKKLKSQLRHILADKMDLEENEEASDLETSKINQRLSEVRCELHKTFLEEDKLIVSIADLQEKVFPEMNNLYPDFGLREYNKYKGIVKAGLEIEHFDLQPAALDLSSGIPHYFSTFMDHPVRLQEYQLSSEEEKEHLLSCVLQYRAVSHPNLLPVDAVFFTKKCVHAYVQQPSLPTLQSFMEENEQVVPEKMMTILRDILHALSALHAQGIVHGSLHPTTVYMGPNNTVIDSVSFQPHKPLRSLPLVNGINFQEIDTGSCLSCGHDIYSFALLSLWMLYPKMEFVLSADGKPVLQDLPLDAFKVEILKLFNLIMDTTVSELQTCNVLNHPALNKVPENFQVLEYTDVPDADSDFPVSEQSTTTSSHEKLLETSESTRAMEESQDHYPYVEAEESESSEEEEEHDNLEDTLLAYDSIRMNQCSLGLSEATNET